MHGDKACFWATVGEGETWRRGVWETNWTISVECCGTTSDAERGSEGITKARKREDAKAAEERTAEDAEVAVGDDER
jgi:hypothetical protein